MCGRELGWRKSFEKVEMCEEKLVMRCLLCARQTPIAGRVVEETEFCMGCAWDGMCFVEGRWDGGIWREMGK